MAAQTIDADDALQETWLLAMQSPPRGFDRVCAWLEGLPRRDSDARSYVQPVRCHRITVLGFTINRVWRQLSRIRRMRIQKTRSLSSIFARFTLRLSTTDLLAKGDVSRGRVGIDQRAAR